MIKIPQPSIWPIFRRVHFPVRSVRPASIESDSQCGTCGLEQSFPPRCDWKVQHTMGVGSEAVNDDERDLWGLPQIGCFRWVLLALLPPSARTCKESCCRMFVGSM